MRYLGDQDFWEFYVVLKNVKIKFCTDLVTIIFNLQKLVFAHSYFLDLVENFLNAKVLANQNVRSGRKTHFTLVQLWGIFFVYFRFSQQRFYRKNVDLSGIRTRMVRVEVQVTTTAVLSTTKVKNKVDTKARSYEVINLSKDQGWFILLF